MVASDPFLPSQWRKTHRTAYSEGKFPRFLPVSVLRVLRSLSNVLMLKQITTFGLEKPSGKWQNGDRRRSRGPDPGSRLLYFTRMTCYSKFTRLLLALGWMMSQGSTMWAWSGGVTTTGGDAVQIIGRVEKRIMGNVVLLVHLAICGPHCQNIFFFKYLEQWFVYCSAHTVIVFYALYFNFMFL